MLVKGENVFYDTAKNSLCFTRRLLQGILLSLSVFVKVTDLVVLLNDSLEEICW